MSEILTTVESVMFFLASKARLIPTRYCWVDLNSTYSTACIVVTRPQKATSGLGWECGPTGITSDRSGLDFEHGLGRP